MKSSWANSAQQWCHFSSLSDIQGGKAKDDAGLWRGHCEDKSELATLILSFSGTQRQQGGAGEQSGQMEGVCWTEQWYRCEVAARDDGRSRESHWGQHVLLPGRCFVLHQPQLPNEPMSFAVFVMPEEDWKRWCLSQFKGQNGSQVWLTLSPFQETNTSSLCFFSMWWTAARRAGGSSFPHFPPEDFQEAQTVQRLWTDPRWRWTHLPRSVSHHRSLVLLSAMAASSVAWDGLGIQGQKVQLAGEAAELRRRWRHTDPYLNAVEGRDDNQTLDSRGATAERSGRSKLTL